MNKNGSRSYVYPHEPSPLHFTQLYYPKPTVFVPSPATHLKPRRHGYVASSIRCCCCSLFAAICSLLLTACTLIGLTVFITWLVLRPITAPRYSIDTVEFRSLRVITSNNTLNADVDYTITASNPNSRLGFRYDRMEFETSYRGYVFGRSAVAAFYQGHQNVSMFTSGFVVESFTFAPERFGSELSTDWNSGNIAFHLRGSAKIRARVGVITSMAVNVLVDCDFAVKVPSGNVTNKICTLTR